MSKKRIVLVGGGHTHTLVLRNLKAPLPHPITLVSESRSLFYTGMLPGFIAGHYGMEDISISLPRLCERVGADFVLATAKAINDDTVITDKGPLPFDIASLNLGVSSSLPAATQQEHSLPLKPVTDFVARWQELLRRKEKMRLVVVGGGAGGLEVALALAWRLKGCRISLIAADNLLPGYAAKLVRLAKQRLGQLEVQLRERSWVRSWWNNSLVIRSAESTEEAIKADYVFWTTHGIPPKWLKDCALSLDARGFVRVNHSLQSLSHPNVFAVGDLACMTGHSLAKAGVFAVRQAPCLGHNLLAMAQGQKLTGYDPQKEFLALLSLGNKSALGQRGRFCFAGAWVWYWKNYLDRSFVNRLTRY